MFAEESDDVDSAQLFKIRSFIEMTKHYKNIGLLLDESLKDSKKINELIESWPLVQSYGLSSMKTGGFFTMTHTISNIQSNLIKILHNLDNSYIMKSLIDSYLFTHFQNVIDNINQMPIGERNNLTSEQIIEPLSCYYEYSTISNQATETTSSSNGNINNNKLDIKRGPYCRIQENVKRNEKLYFIIKGDDNDSGLQCNRTYFTENGGDNSIYNDKTVFIYILLHSLFLSFLTLFFSLYLFYHLFLFNRVCLVQ